MTTSPERAGAAPWYCSHESSRAATSTMVAAGLVAAAALMAFVALLVAGDEVSALVAAMVMLVAGANTWSAGRSRTWWRAEPVADRAVRTRPASPAPPAPPAPSASPAPSRPRPQVAVRVSDDQGHVRQGPRPGELHGVPVAAAGSRAVPAFDDQGHVRQGPRPDELRGVPVAAPPAPRPAVVHLATVASAPAARAEVAPAARAEVAPAARAEAAETVELDRGRQSVREVAATAASPEPGTSVTSPGDDAATARATPRPARSASTPAARTRRRTVAVRPVTRRVAGTRPS